MTYVSLPLCTPHTLPNCQGCTWSLASSEEYRDQRDGKGLLAQVTTDEGDYWTCEVGQTAIVEWQGLELEGSRQTKDRYIYKNRVK